MNQTAAMVNTMSEKTVLSAQNIRLFACASLCVIGVSSVQAADINIIAGDQVIHATLVDNVASRDFLAMLPIKVELSDYHSTEKIAYLPESLATDGLPKAMDPEIGDFTYFAPWGNLALFYRDFGYSRGLVKLGTIQPEDLATLKSLSRMQVTFERAEP